MPEVTGFGGFFFRAQDPTALADWYFKWFGINPVPADETGRVWEQAAGPTVFAPFAADTDYFGDPAKQFMLNFRVADLDAMIIALEAGGIAVERNTEELPYGRFARLVDPEGNPIELWEPAVPPK